MNLEAFLEKLNTTPGDIEFEQTMAVIDDRYEFTATSFKNGDLVNAAGQNSGSCKIFAFAQLHNLSPAQTLACFGIYYRDDVLPNPDGTDHQNIRNFMQSGWAGIAFESMPLTAKQDP